MPATSQDLIGLMEEYPAKYARNDFLVKSSEDRCETREASSAPLESATSLSHILGPIQANQLRREVGDRK